MNKIVMWVVAALFFLCPPEKITGEFYEFIDENGIKTFTDDPGIIPESRQDAIRTHKERYDDLSDEEKALVIQADQDRLMQLHHEREEDVRRRAKLRKIRELEQEAAREAKAKEALKTPVTISNNQILVPVTVTYRGKALEVTLLLDTGANITTLNTTIAERLEITEGKRSSARVANGSRVRTQLSSIDSLQVGPKSLASTDILVMPYKGPSGSFDGLLGLDFLRHFSYDIDYRNSLIVWKE